MDVSYSKQAQCAKTGNSYVNRYYLGSGCDSASYDVTYTNKQSIMTTPLPYYAGYYMDVLCFVQSSTTMSPTKSTTKHLKSYVAMNVNDGNKEMVPEVKY